MNRADFRRWTERGLIVLDGATGTELSKRGMPPGACPESWVIDNPDALHAVQREYREAGADIVYASTFGANRFKLEEFGLVDRLTEINSEIVRIAKEAVGDGFVFGDLAPTGQLIQPFGPCPLEDCIEAYKEQARALVDSGVDGFIIETMMDIQEARAALIAVREVCDLPTMVTITVGEDGRTLTGTDPETALVTLQALGADAFGLNCSTGPAQMLEHIKRIKPLATIPLLAKPNAGQPRLKDGETVFDMGAEEFGSHVESFIREGINLLGGCCGTTPDHIRAVTAAAAGKKTEKPRLEALGAVSSAQSLRLLDQSQPLATIGERINPTGKKKLQAELRENKDSLIRQYALDQSQAGAALLDVNMGLSGIDEKGKMVEAIELLSRLTPTPLCLDSTDPEVMEAALRLYPGRALVNSVSAESDRLKRMLPVAAKYGAMFILLPLTDEGIPETLPDRKEVTRLIIEKAEKYGYSLEDLVVDGLVMTVSAQQEAAAVTLDFVEWCARELRVNTTAGVSNISFGLPERGWVNSTFLAMLISRGLNVPIVNPSSEMMMAVKYASDALLGRDPKLATYVRKYSGQSKAPSQGQADQKPEEAAYGCVLNGDEVNIGKYLADAIANGHAPQALVNEYLIPAITKVGELFECKTYFLPQLMMSADAMRAGFDYLEPLLLKEAGGESQKKQTVYLATVEGDIHDIGKNIVALLLKNYGFEVIDLGKDVAAETILDALPKEGTALVGLSALMTTTMTQMKRVLELARERGVSNARFFVGGAVVDQAYADEIGADGYAADAIGAVKLAQSFLK